MELHPEVTPLLQRCWRNRDRSSAADKAALALWVTDRVMNAPLTILSWEDWPPRFNHCQPHRDLSDFIRV
jgi:hypothetical protein